MGVEVKTKRTHWLKADMLREGQTFRNGRIYETIDGWETSTPPVPKDIRDVEGWDLKKKDQRFRKRVLPDFMKRIKIDIVTKKRVYDERQKAFINEEKRRIFALGFWVFIQGRPTWIHGFHYHVLNYWKIGADTDDGYKEYRDRDRRRWMRWRHVELSPFIFGLIYGKHRRDGATIDGYNMMQLYPQMDFERNSGHMHKEDTSAKKGFINMLVRPFRKQPKWLIPENDSKPKSILFRLIDPDTKKKAREYDDEDEEGEDLGGTIDFRATVFNAYDGDKLIFCFLDETGKWKNVDVEETVGVTVQCLSQGAGTVKVGNLYMPTTVEEMKKGGEKFLSLWKDSKPETFDETRQTTLSGLVTLFMPAWDGMEGYIDENGESIIYDPTATQIAFLKKRYPGRKRFIGAKQYIEETLAHLASQGKWDSYNKFVRKFPCKESDMFISSSEDIMFNRQIIQAVIQTIRSNNALHKDDFQRGNLEWVDEPRRRVLKWVPNDVNGRIGIAKFFLRPEEAGRVKWNGKFASPMNGHRFVFSLDPYAKALVKNKKGGSKGAGIGLIMFDEDNEVRHFEPGGRERASYYHTPAWFCTYYARPQSMDVFHEDILKLCHYFSMPLAFENNVDLIADYFVKRGYEDFILKSSDFIDVDLDKVNDMDRITPGCNMNPQMKEKGIQLLANFIEGIGNYLNGWEFSLVKEWRRFPFLDWLEDLLNFDYADSEKNDRTMSCLPGLIYMDKIMKEKYYSYNQDNPTQEEEEFAELLEDDEFW